MLGKGNRYDQAEPEGTCRTGRQRARIEPLTSSSSRDREARRCCALEGGVEVNADVLALALEEFRTDLGIAADPERYPDLWAVYVEDARVVVSEARSRQEATR